MISAIVSASARLMSIFPSPQIVKKFAQSGCFCMTGPNSGTRLISATALNCVSVGSGVGAAVWVRGAAVCGDSVCSLDGIASPGRAESVSDLER